jgi:uncharacterized membrane-anchored protein
MIYLILIIAGVSAASIFINEYIFDSVQIWIDNSKLPSALKVLLTCLTCLSFWTTLVISLCFGQGWLSIPLALCGSLLAREIKVFEDDRNN